MCILGDFVLVVETVASGLVLGYMLLLLLLLLMMMMMEYIDVLSVTGLH